MSEPGRFTEYETHEAARCFSCDSALLRVAPSGYPEHDGAWVATCPQCGMRTWYDVPDAGKSTLTG